MTERHLRRTDLLDIDAPAIRDLIDTRGWMDLASFERIGAAYDFVRGEIAFGYNRGEAIPASEVLWDGYGQCNTKATLLMALLRALGIPCRLHGFTIHKALQRGVVPEIAYRIAPESILHSRVEVERAGAWVDLEGFILDAPFLAALQTAFEGRTSLCAYGAGTDCLADPPVAWTHLHPAHRDQPRPWAPRRPGHLLCRARSSVRHRARVPLPPCDPPLDERPRRRHPPGAGAPYSRRRASRALVGHGPSGGGAPRWGPGHDHAHDHGHRHAGHSHGPTLSADDSPEARSSKERAILIAAIPTGGFMGAEVVGGLVSGSLALLADAGHMLTDFASLMLAWFAFRLARRPADRKRTYGLDRFPVLAAFVNGLTLFAIAAWILLEAVQRLRDPHEVLGGLMLWGAVGGLVVNVLAFWVLSRAEGDNLNVRAAALHVLGDLLGSVAAIAASLVIIWTGWTPIDPILSVLVVPLILRSAWAVVHESGHILLEGAPAGFDARAVAADLEATVPDVARAHHIHAWSITQERPMATLEVDLAPGAQADDVRRAVKDRVRETTGMEHVTVEVATSAAQAR